MSDATLPPLPRHQTPFNKGSAQAGPFSFRLIKLRGFVAVNVHTIRMTFLQHRQKY